MAKSAKPTKKPKLKTLFVTMTEAWDLESQVETIFCQIRKAGIKTENALLCVFEGKNKPKTEGNVFCLTEQEFIDCCKTRPYEMLEMFGIDQMYTQLAIAFYDIEQMKYSASQKEYEIKSPSALYAIVYVK